MYQSAGRTIHTLVLVSFLNGLELSIFYSTLWPYALSVDSSLTISFFGYITAAFSIGQCISSILFGLWMDRTMSARSPLICGLFIISISNVVYCLAASSAGYGSGKLVVLFSRILLGFGTGTISVTRALAPRVGCHNVRSIALVQGAYSLGCTVGPFLQISLYTAGPLLLAALNGLAILPVNVFLEETAPRKQIDIITEFPPLEVNYSRKRDNSTVCMVIATIFVVKLIAANIDSILSAYAELMWSWEDEENIKNIGHFHTIHGITQICIFFIVSTVLNRHIGGEGIAVQAVIISLVLSVFFYLLTYPYSIFGEFLDCQEAFSWCQDTSKVNVFAFFLAFAIVLATSFTLIGIFTNLIFCEAAGESGQGALMGLLTATANVAKILGPVLMTSLYEQFGPRPIWLTMIFLLICCICYWIFHWRRQRSTVVLMK